MKAKSRFILLALILLVFGLLLFNNYKAFYWVSVKPDLEWAKILFGIGALSTAFCFLTKRWSKMLTLVGFITLVFSLILNLTLLREYYMINRYDQIIDEYSKIPCDKVKEQFEKDLREDDLKYFISGGFYNQDVANKFNVEVLSNGTVDMIIGIEESMACYNKWVAQYLGQKYEIDFTKELYQNITDQNVGF